MKRRRGPRPSELVVLAFGAYCLVRIAASSTWAVRTHTAPRADVLVVLLFVVTIRLGMAYKDRAWPTAMTEARRRNWLLLPVFVTLGAAPGVLALRAFPEFLPRVVRDGGAVTTVILFAYACVRAALGVLVPGPFLWFATSLYRKRHGTFSLKGFMRDAAPTTLDVFRDWTPPLALIYVYFSLIPVVGRGMFPDRDAVLAHIDRVLFFGRDPLELCSRILWAPLSEWLSGCYVFYAPLYALALGSLFAMRARVPYRETAFALCAVLALGYVGYALVPAVGPVFVRSFDRSVELYYTAWLKTQLMDRTRVPRDCFPSLHTAVSLTLEWGLLRHRPTLARALAPVVFSIPIACVYLRYHYVADVLAGIGLFVAVTAYTARSRWLRAAFAEV